MPAGLGYRLGRAVVDSDLELVELPGVADQPAALVLRRGAVQAPRAWQRTWRVDGEVDARLAAVDDGYVLDLAAGARCHIADGFVRYQSTLDDAALARLLVHQALPRVLAHQGALLVHGSAAVIGGGAVALIGRSGAGKSTLAAALAGDGGRLVADDAVWIDDDRDPVRCCGSYPGGWLSRQASDALGLPSPARGADDKAHLLVDLGIDADAPLTDVICIVESGDDERELLSIEPMSAGELYFGLFDHAFQLDPSHRARAAALFEQLTRVAAAVRGWRAKLPDDHDRLPEICRRVREVVGAAREGS